MSGYYILASRRNGTLYTGVTWALPRRPAIFMVYETRLGTAPSPPSSCARHRDEAINKRRRVSQRAFV